MTAEQHAKLMIGDLLFTVARLQAENDALREQLPSPPVPAPNGEAGSVPSAET